VVCDNEGYAVIERLQVSQGGASYNNMLKDSVGTGSDIRVNFKAHAESMGAVTFEVNTLGEFSKALVKARAADRTAVIVTKVRAQDFTEGGAFWQVGVPEVSERSQVTAARAKMDKGLKDQRPGV
jgi:3D-(3,5/4)-trihydroxycyclohexane-1,2-dione acylhydrolase (decyclizing)